VGKMRFRNYVPHNKAIMDTSEEPDAEQASMEVANGEEGFSLSVSALISSASVAPSDVLKQELDSMSAEGPLQLVPKHPNWDLKAGIEERMSKLRRRTQRAIVDILREKIAADSEMAQ